MMTYFIKSTLSLIILYGFYHFILKQQKMFLFNRFYLITSLLFSLIVPFIDIPVRTDYPIIITIGRVASLTAPQIERVGTNAYNIAADFSFTNILIYMYFVISGILLIRFVFNIIKIFIKIKGAED